jgi:hypothetical protein
VIASRPAGRLGEQHLVRPKAPAPGRSDREAVGSRGSRAGQYGGDNKVRKLQLWTTALDKRCWTYDPDIASWERHANYITTELDLSRLV